MDRKRWALSACIASFFSGAAILFVAGTVSANPVLVQDPLGLVSWLLISIINIPLNISILLLVTYAGLVNWSTRILQSRSALEFLSLKVGVAGAIISVFGGLIDIELLLDENSQMVYRSVFWASALGLIFLSVLVCMTLIAGVRVAFSFFTAWVVIAVNAAFWSALLAFGVGTDAQDEVMGTLVLLDAVAIVCSIGLGYLISKFCDEEISRPLKTQA